MWELDCEESWAPKNWCFWTVVLEKTLESPLDCKEIQPVHSEGDQPWEFFGRTDAEAETPILWPPHAKSWLIGKDPDVGKDWRQEEKGTTADKMVGWHHRLDGHEFESTLVVGDGLKVLVCCSSCSRKELEMTEWLNWTDEFYQFLYYIWILIHLVFIFVYGVRKCSSFILLQVVDQFYHHLLLERFSFLYFIFLPSLSKTICP